jgi:hypothetical protein
MEIDESRSPIKKALVIHQPNRRFQFLHRGRKVQERHVLDDLPDSDVRYRRRPRRRGAAGRGPQPRSSRAVTKDAMDFPGPDRPRSYAATP